MAHKIALVTDSTCDIPEDWIEQYDITVVPLTIIFGNQQFRDGIDLTSEAFYARLPNDPAHPSTSQPTPGAFRDAYCRALEHGAEAIIVITIARAMSGTYESARQAAEGFEIPVHVFDGQNNSMGLGWQVIAAARVREAGGSLEDMVAAASRVREKMVYYVALDTIEYLSKGGRIADAARFVSSFLQIKPLIYVKPASGAVGASIPARTRKASLQGVYKEFFKHFADVPGQSLHLTVLHNDAREEAEAVAERIRQEYAPKELFVTITSPVLGAHTGPGAVAILGYSED
ncbi:MAG TPA: DegV family protein [Anaerolineaceae bacterium]|nr:DegV family protein [Anaerolineaceae bacterium]